MQETINGLLVALAILIVSQITQFIRSATNRKLIKGARADILAATRTIEDEREAARVYREKNEEDAKALQIRITQEALDRNAQLLATLREEREEQKANLAEWREDRAEWKKERQERDKQIATLDKAYMTLKAEFEAVKRELDLVREESADRENVIRDQSKTIEAQAETISRHETTIAELTARVATLEDMNAELERQRIEALKGTALPPPSDELINLKRGTKEVKKTEIVRPKDSDLKPTG